MKNIKKVKTTTCSYTILLKKKKNTIFVNRRLRFWIKVICVLYITNRLKCSIYRIIYNRRRIRKKNYIKSNGNYHKYNILFNKHRGEKKCIKKNIGKRRKAQGLVFTIIICSAWRNIKRSRIAWQTKRDLKSYFWK